MLVSRNVTKFVALLFCLCLFGCARQVSVTAADQPATVPVKEESWYVIYLGGQKVGFSQSIAETVQQNGVEIVKTASLTNMTIKRFGQTLVMKQVLTTEESSTGDLLRFRYEEANPPAMSKVTSGTIAGDKLNLNVEVNGQAKTTVKPWKSSVKSPFFQDRLLKEKPLKPGETRSFESFFPEFADVGKVTLKGFDREDVRLLNGVSKRLFKVVSSQSLMAGITSDIFLDEAGEAVKTSMSLVGMTMEMFLVSQEEALKSIKGAELDLMISTLVKVKPIIKGHEAVRAVYRVTVKDQKADDIFPVGNTQSIKKLADDVVELTVVAVPIPRTAKIQKVADEYLESSQYLQCDDERVQNHANQAAGNETDPAEIARRMEKYVQKKLDKKNLFTAMASAAEVAKSMEGDCTEHAVLLAAMLRAKGIPSRVVVGLIYDEHAFAFAGHMWTEANLNGEWIPLDGTRGEGGASAAYIKLAESSLSDNGPTAVSGLAPLMTVIGKLKLDVISAE